MDSKVLLKQRYQSISQGPDSAPLETISFRHPGYDDPEDILFKLPRLDSHPQSELTGVHHGTALLACQIIANNAFDGYLATDRDGTNRVSIAPDEILLDEIYWFIVAGQDVYAIVPWFEEWSFPHKHLNTLGWDPIQTTADNDERPLLTSPTMPTATATATATASATTASATTTIPSTIPFVPLPRPTHSRCILSNDPWAIQKAHLVPSAQSKWFQANSMIFYGNDRQFVHNDHNIVPIRRDLHTVWDSNLFALVPKRGGFVVHVLTIPNIAISEFAAEWHNRPVQEGALDNTAKAYLFARFAQAVFMLLMPFVAYSAVPRFIVTLETRADDPRRPYEAKEDWVSPFTLGQMCSGGGSREPIASADSRKRSRSQASAQGDEDEETKWSKVYVCGMSWASGSEEMESGSNWYDETARGRLWASDSEDDVERGRSRKRRQRRRSE